MLSASSFTVRVQSDWKFSCVLGSGFAGRADFTSTHGLS
jgi:hypothetical protein